MYSEMMPMIRLVRTCVSIKPLCPWNTTVQFMKFPYHHVEACPLRNPGTRKTMKSLRITVAPSAK